MLAAVRMKIKTIEANDAPSPLPIGTHPHLQRSSSRFSDISKITTHHDVLFLLEIVGLDLLVFAKDFCVYLHGSYWSHVVVSLFSSFVTLLSNFHIKVMLASWNELENIPFSHFLKEFVTWWYVSWMFDRIHKWNLLGLKFSLWEIFKFTYFNFFIRYQAYSGFLLLLQSYLANCIF